MQTAPATFAGDLAGSALQQTLPGWDGYLAAANQPSPRARGATKPGDVLWRVCTDGERVLWVHAPSKSQAIKWGLQHADERANARLATAEEQRNWGPLAATTPPIPNSVRR